ncbi:MAG TPA: hypothetical protein VKD08_04245 [Ignavibacteriaceae bacterium]|nr:hypothetical protein [Ignavibacteriaceae bacterium]
MTKSNSCICLLPLSPVFTTGAAPVFETFTPEYSSQLYSILYENYMGIFQELNDISTVVYCLDENDREIPKCIAEKFTVRQWINTSEINAEIKNLNDKYFKRFHSNIIIFAHSIGVSGQDVKKIFSLLEMEDESLLIGRDNDERIALLGFNTYNEELMGNIFEDRNHYNEMLIKASKHENFVHTLNNFMLIESREDFKKLYSELSKKESLTYCNQDIHEKFTHLFIEYKDLLK